MDRVAVVGVLAASLAFTSSASADLDEVNPKKLREGVTVNGILQHERALQQIARRVASRPTSRARRRPDRADPARLVRLRGQGRQRRGGGRRGRDHLQRGPPGRTDVFAGTLGGEAGIPVVGLSFADAQALHTQLASGPVTMHVKTSTENRPGAKTKNLLADSKHGDSSQVVGGGAHLDWGAEKSGLLGSEHYVETLGTGVSNIYANLNFDMTGSPNYVRFA